MGNQQTYQKILTIDGKELTQISFEHDGMNASWADKVIVTILPHSFIGTKQIYVELFDNPVDLLDGKRTITPTLFVHVPGGFFRRVHVQLPIYPENKNVGMYNFLGLKVESVNDCSAHVSTLHFSAVALYYDIRDKVRLSLLFFILLAHFCSTET